MSTLGSIVGYCIACPTYNVAAVPVTMSKETRRHELLQFLLQTLFYLGFNLAPDDLQPLGRVRLEPQHQHGLRV